MPDARISVSCASSRAYSARPAAYQDAIDGEACKRAGGQPQRAARDHRGKTHPDARAPRAVNLFNTDTAFLPPGATLLAPDGSDRP